MVDLQRIKQNQKQTIIKMKRSYLNFVAILGLAAGVAVLPGCKKDGCTDPAASNYDDAAKNDDGSCVYDAITGELTENTTWGSDRIHYLQGRVVVPAGVTLTIEAGAIIKGMPGTETNASALVVAKGGKLIANGTATEPIIFTAESDDIQLGQLVGSNLQKDDNELWGGVIILGNAKVSTENGNTTGNIEGIPANLGYGEYGGTDDSDDSGILNYVSIRHGGIAIGEGNEINGLTLGGVGNGTQISNIEIYATLDDGIECFGGSVDISDALVFFQGDDGLDLDQNYSGTISGFAVIHGDGIGTDEGLEIDGPEGTTYVDGQFHLMNGICKYVDAAGSGSAGDFKSKAQGKVHNVTFDYPSTVGDKIKFRTKFVDPGTDCTHKSDAYLYLTASTAPQKLEFMNCALPTGGASVYDGDDSGECLNELDAAQATAAAALTNGSGSTYGYATKFDWSAAGQRGEL